MAFLTSSSAIAKRPLDASCLSVVSFNTTKRRVESFIVSNVGYVTNNKRPYSTFCLRRLQICHCLQLNALFCCIWHNVEASCHKHFVVFSSKQHRHLLPAMCHNLRHAGRAPPVTAFTQHLPVAALTQAVKPDIGSESRFLPSHLHLTPPLGRGGGFPSEYCHPVWCGKTIMVWLPDGETN